MFRSRCSRENDSSLERCVRTTSPSRTVTGRPSASSWATRASATVDFPAPERPVRKTVTPGAWAWGMSPVSRSSARARGGGCPSAAERTPGVLDGDQLGCVGGDRRGGGGGGLAGAEGGQGALLEPPPVTRPRGHPDAGQRAGRAGVLASSRPLPVHLGEETLLDAHDTGDGDLRRRERQPVATLAPALTDDQAGVLEVAEDGLQEAGRDSLRRRDAVSGQRLGGHGSQLE